jgi:hypothetical protein
MENKLKQKIKKTYSVGDEYIMTSRGFFEYILNGGCKDNYPFVKEYKCTVVYIIENGGVILKVNDPITDDTFDSSLLFGNLVKTYFPDFDGDDNETYCIPYYDGCPLYD